MGAGATGPIIGQRTDHRTDQFDHRDRYLPRRSAKLPLAVFAAAVALTACAWDPPTIERTPREAVGTESNAKSRLAARKGGAQQNGTPGAAPSEKIDVPGTDMAALEVDLTNFKERLIGLDSDEINDLMGTPGLERAEPPALIWQYRHQVCTVDIFMFDDGAGATVDHVEVRPTTSGGVNEKDCFTALLRNAPQSGGGGAKAPSAQQPVAPSPSTPVTRGPSAPAASSPATSPTRPPVPSSAAPSAAPAMPPPAGPDGEDGPPPTDTDVDFDFGPAPNSAPALSGASTNPALPSVQDRPPSAAPSSEAIPTLPPELMLDEKPPSAPPAPQGPSSSLGIDIPAVSGADEFADPLDSATPPPAVAKPAAAPASPPKPAPAPVATVPAPAMPAVTAPPPPAVAPPPPAQPAAKAPPPAPDPAQLAPRPATATASAAQPKGASKAAPAARPVEDIDDDLPPDVLGGRRDDDPAHNNEDMVE